MTLLENESKHELFSKHLGLIIIMVMGIGYIKQPFFLILNREKL
jgi:hypothetical protein